MVTCEPLSRPINYGTKVGSDYSYNKTVTFTCNTGFHISNERKTSKDRQLTCQDDGLWSGEVPTCSSKLLIPRLSHFEACFFVSVIGILRA